MHPFLSLARGRHIDARQHADRARPRPIFGRPPDRRRNGGPDAVCVARRLSLLSEKDMEYGRSDAGTHLA